MDLSNRTWPTPPDRKKLAVFSKQRSRDMAFVREGRLVNRRLALYEGVAEIMPPGECAIGALVRARAGNIYGVTFGKRAHFFYYDPTATGDGVLDVGPIPGATRCAAALAVDDDGNVFGGVADYDDTQPGGYLFRTDTRGHKFHEYHARRNPCDNLGVPVPGEGIATVAASTDGRTILGLSTDTSTLFLYKVTDEPQPGGFDIVGPLSDAPVAPVLLTHPDGSVLGFTTDGVMLRIDVATKSIERTDVQVDDCNEITRATLDPVTGTVYLGIMPGGRLVSVDPVKQTVNVIGPVQPCGPIRSLTVGNDGTLYGTTGPRNQMSHLFVLNPSTHELRDLAKPMATHERYWHGYEFDAACTGSQGEIYLGESDRISHLWIYFPPVRPR